ncbi:dispersed gene family protein 1 (DGF-1), putative, partial [Trypanosoma cruzi marinkellei]
MAWRVVSSLRGARPFFAARAGESRRRRHELRGEPDAGEPHAELVEDAPLLRECDIQRRGCCAEIFLDNMPLHLFINITFTGCTFRDGAALQFFGGAEAAESAGVLIRVSQTVMRSSVVVFAIALPQHCDIAVTEVDVVHSSAVHLPDTVNNMCSVVMLHEVVLTASSLLVSNVNAHASRYGAFGLYSTGTLALVGGSSLYARYCSFDGYTHLFHLHNLSVREHSVFALLNNTMTSGTSLLYQYYGFSVLDNSVLRVVGNSGSVSYAIYSLSLW